MQLDKKLVKIRFYIKKKIFDYFFMTNLQAQSFEAFSHFNTIRYPKSQVT